MTDNRQTALNFLEKLNEGILPDDLITEDFTAWIPGQGVVKKADFLNMIAFIRGYMKGKTVMDVHGVTAEGDRVAVESESRIEMTSGKIYNNTYHFLFKFRDGKIYQSKEYNDSKHAADTFAGMF